MLKGLLEKVKGKGKWIGAMALSAALFAPGTVKAEAPDLPIVCDAECSILFNIEGDVDITAQVMGVADLEGYLSLITTNIKVTNPEMEVEGLVRALSKNDQFLEINTIFNTRMTNEASVSGDVLKNAEGNIGVNVAAGDVNAQSNIAALAAGKAEKSMTQSTIFSVQRTEDNWTFNYGSSNTASVSDSVLKNAKGNIGVNVAAGAMNAQSNQLAVSVAPAKVGVASAYVKQEGLWNWTDNYPIEEEKLIFHEYSLKLSAWGEASSTSFSGSYKGSEGGTFSEGGEIEGTSTGMSYQASNIYPDIWVVNDEYEPHNQHPNSPEETSHMDIDYETQGAVINPLRTTDDETVGGLAFDNDNKIEAGYEGEGEYEGTESGSLGGTIGAQKINLTGTVTGVIPVKIIRHVDSINTATLSGEVLMNAVGNIGVNVAAGSNNMQVNALSVAYVPENAVEVPAPQPGLE